MPVDHYENFPVASWLLPARLREPVEAIYRFARGADDIADEGDAPDAERLRGLDRYLAELDRIEAGGSPDAEPFARLAVAVRRYGLPVPLLRDLIDAFKQDVVRKRYATYAELQDYARRSANPIGRLLLHLGTDSFSCPAEPAVPPDGKKSPSPVLQSDAICSALQFINFWQDVAVDYRKGRIYIPQEDMARFGVGEEHIARGTADERWRALMRFECERSRALLRSGAPLARALPGRLGLEIGATVEGGAAILDKIDRVSGDVFRNRPVLGAWDWVKILGKSLAGRT